MKTLLLPLIIGTFIVSPALAMEGHDMKGMSHDMGKMDMSGMDMKDMKGMDHGAMHDMHHNMSVAPTPLLVTVDPVHLPLVAHEEIKIHFTVKDQNGLPLGPDDLALVHTKKIHVLAIDPSLTDYHHLHPTASKTAGEYDVSFTPDTAGPYNFFVQVSSKDAQPMQGLFTLGGDYKAAAKLTPTSTAIIDGTKFILLPMDQDIHAGKMIEMTVRVSDVDDKPVTTLRPIMGAFAHLVAFDPDGTGINHMHPMGTEPTKETERGGPEMKFMFTPQKPGLTPLFAQVNLNNTVITVPFTLEIKP